VSTFPGALPPHTPLLLLPLSYSSGGHFFFFLNFQKKLKYYKKYDYASQTLISPKKKTLCKQTKIFDPDRRNQ